MNKLSAIRNISGRFFIKSIFSGIFFLLSSSLSATTYYVSTSGSNTNNGLTTSTPWQTLQYAESKATAAGDIIALKRGDTWSLSTTVAIKHGGSSGNHIIWDGSLWGTGENAKILVSGNRPDGNIAAVHFITAGCAYVTFKNIIVDGNNKFCYGIVIGYHSAISGNKQNNEHDIIVDGCTILNCGNGGEYCMDFLCQTWYTDIWNISIKNCTLDGSDDEQLSFYCARSDEGWDQQQRECRNIYVGYNSLTNWGRRGQSTGYGLQINNKVTGAIIEHNTFTPGPYGRGGAVHIESNDPIKGWFPTGIVFRYNKVTQTLSNEWSLYFQGGQAMTVDVYYNIFIQGTKQTDTDGGCVWITNTGAYTGASLNFWNNVFYSTSARTFQNDCATAGACTLRNNILFNSGSNSGSYCLIINTSGSTVHSNNLYFRTGAGDILYNREGSKYIYKSGISGWESTAKSDDPFFTDLAGLNFHLQSGSCAIRGGVSIPVLNSDFEGAPVGSTPNIGCYESLTSTPAPEFNSAVIENATPALLEMSYNISLANVVPASSSFNVQVNSNVVAVNSVAIVNGKVHLTLASAVAYGDIISVSYTKPSVNPLQSISGETASSISAKPVTNNCVSVTLDYVSSVVQNNTPTILEISYSLALANIIPAVSAFIVLVNSVSKPVSSVSISGNIVRLTLSGPIIFSDQVTVAYTKPASNFLQTTGGIAAASMAAKPVTNNTISNIPVYQSSVVENASPSNLEMTYNLSLANIVPSNSAFNVLVNSVSRNVTSVSISGNKVRLTLISPVLYGDVITVSYTKPANLYLQTPTGGAASSISGMPVTNNCILPVPVYLSSVVQDATPSLLEMTYDLNLANIVPSASAFTVRVNSIRRSVNSVSIVGSKVNLTLASPIVNGDIITVSYTSPVTNPIQSVEGGKAASIINMQVTNNCYSNSYIIIPVFESASVEDAAPSVVELNYDATLANIIPAISAFTVRVNSVARQINSVAISGIKVRLTLASPIVYGDVVTVSYTKPVTNPVQTPSGGQAISLNPQTVTNNINEISSVYSPVYVSSVVENAAPSVLKITYDKNLNSSIVPSGASFNVQVNLINDPVSSVAISGSIISLTLSTPIVNGDIIKVSYSMPSVNPVQTITGYKAASYTLQPVTNNVNPVAPVVIPVYYSSAIQNSTPDILEMSYNIGLANIVPSSSAFIVQVNYSTRPITSVAIVGGKVRLTLATPVVFGDVVTVAYVKPFNDPLQTAQGGVAASLGSQLVVNNVLENIINIPPSLNVNYDSVSYTGFIYTLDATGTSDANKDNLIYEWTTPNNVPVSGFNDSKLQFLSPLVTSEAKLVFSLKVSDGKSIETKMLPVTFKPYKQGLSSVKIQHIDASNSYDHNDPGNAIDNNIQTKWSADGRGQSLVFKLLNQVKISHLGITFPSDETRAYFFDIYASQDSIFWEPILINNTSCDFSWNYQIFAFPESFTSIDYKYLKFVGQGNTEDSWNNISDFKIFGIPHADEVQINVYPNPARDNINVSIEYPGLIPVDLPIEMLRRLRIYDIAGNLVSEKILESGNNYYNIPINYKSGIYVIQMIENGQTVATRKLIVMN